MLLSVLILMCIAMVFTIKLRNVAILLLGILIIIAAFALYFITGNINLPIRTLVGLAFFPAFCFSLLFIVSKDIKWRKIKPVYLLSLIIVSMVLSQSKIMNESFFVNYMRYQRDCTKLTSIMSDVYKVTGPYESKPIFLLGQAPEYDFSSYSYIKDGVVGLSIFNWWERLSLDGEIASTRVRSFAQMHGYSLPMPVNYNIGELSVRVRPMKYWPQDGSIEEFPEYIIVKMGPSSLDSHSETILGTSEDFLKKYNSASLDIDFNPETLTENETEVDLGGWLIIQNLARWRPRTHRIPIPLYFS